VIPKKSLTGDSTERVDTRVLQVIYRVKDRNAPLYVGQQMDVYVETQGTTNTFHQHSDSTAEVGSEMAKFDRGYPFVSAAGGLRSRSELQTVAGLVPEGLDGYIGPWNLNEATADR